MKLIVILTILFPIYTLGQMRCYEIDSIVVKYFPLTMTTPFSIKMNEFNKSEPLLETKIFTDYQIIKEFIIIQLIDTNRLFRNENVQDLDYRIIIESYSSKQKIEDFGLNSKKWYKYLGSIYQPNYELIKWLEIYVLSNGKESEK